MQIEFQPFTVNKRFPLQISYGTTAASTNIWLKIIHDGIEGWGEASPFRAQGQPVTLAMIETALKEFIPELEPFTPYQRQEIGVKMAQAHLPSSVQAAIDVALYDWFGKSVGLPLWRIWGLDIQQIQPTSVTIGINTPSAAQERTLAWLEFADIQVLKIKLGNPQGIIADQQMFTAIKEVAPHQELLVDANGGWDVENAIAMGRWLADFGVRYIEQPLARGEEAKLSQVKQNQPLPIFVDESCCHSGDILALAAHIDGINIKLMKCGGITPAMQMIQVARACGLQVMFGCYSDSALTNTAAAQLSPLADYLDLDSHLNLVNDPFRGAILHQGRVVPNNSSGLGVEHCAAGT
ncbi:dipeptide epimerase [Calothrix sp. NIES-3974]|uniref:dipeptide epimerase n=1 Tax=Calothrix sp. NIES-3974 TaxID=2005462 RepID=UPI000B61BFC1|nr:dipeptide epimerase [Calothrix sp. NIES-3974]BAZ05696.1 Mandelate racemase/muconate lactonizing enzyme [Calothrix sp. NIES-3974]